MPDGKMGAAKTGTYSVGGHYQPEHRTPSETHTEHAASVWSALAAPRLTGTLAPQILSCFGDGDSERHAELGGVCHFSSSRLFNQYNSMSCSDPAESSLYKN